jgi:hypothetical protein
MTIWYTGICTGILATGILAYWLQRDVPMRPQIRKQLSAGCPSAVRQFRIGPTSRIFIFKMCDILHLSTYPPTHPPIHPSTYPPCPLTTTPTNDHNDALHHPRHRPHSRYAGHCPRRLDRPNRRGNDPGRLPLSSMAGGRRRAVLEQHQKSAESREEQRC